ncbi:hypothetical protein [Streptococcus ruminantium]|uniref:hypothetical protein n=1 Tax=Streptococcus ruminantium TaxID=1917441 RepID=UPI0012DBE31B|nr:hypothetical protein [Streptococcus ruminantium]BDD39954.1 hypothetical protein GUT184_02180 [Streptococcus ruminantium]
MKKNLLKKLSYIIAALLTLMSIAGPVTEVANADSNSSIEFSLRHNANFEGGGAPSYINLSLYSNKFGTAVSGRSGTYHGPRGSYIVRDHAVHSGKGPHGGSYWKLFKRIGNKSTPKRVGTYDKYGNYIGK